MYIKNHTFNEIVQREPGALLREVYRQYLRMLGSNPSIYRFIGYAPTYL